MPCNWNIFGSLSEKNDIKNNNTPSTRIEGGYKLTNEDDQIVEGILEVLPDGYGFLRGKNYLSSPKDVYISSVQIRRFRLDKGDKIKGIARVPQDTEKDKFPALIFVGEVNGESPEKAYRRKKFDDLIPIYPNERIRLETTPNEYAMRIIDLISPIGKGQRGMIVSPPKAGKTTLLKVLGMLDKPEKGTVFCKGKDTKEIYGTELAKIRRTELSFIFQDF